MTTTHHDHELYRAPRECPVCSEELHTIRLGCTNCGTELSGAFRSCEFCGLSDADRALLRVFLVSRGTMREVERHLAVSYPTARARFEELLGRLGLSATQPETAAPQPDPAAPEPPTAEPAAPAPPATDPRLATLHALAAGRLDVATAQQVIDAGGKGSTLPQ